MAATDDVARANPRGPGFGRRCVPGNRLRVPRDEFLARLFVTTDRIFASLDALLPESREPRVQPFARQAQAPASRIRMRPLRRLVCRRSRPHRIAPPAADPLAAAMPAANIFHADASLCLTTFALARKPSPAPNIAHPSEPALRADDVASVSGGRSVERGHSCPPSRSIFPRIYQVRTDSTQSPSQGAEVIKMYRK